MRVRPASSRLRSSCAVGLSVFVVGAAALFTFDGLAAADVPEAAVPAPDDLIVDLGGTTLETRKVPHGVFTMGSAAGEPGHDKDEEPAHQVTISKDFWIGKYPVTRGQFAKFVADTRYVTDAEKGQAGGAGWEGNKVGDAGKAAGLVQKKDFTWRNPGFTQTDSHPVVLVSYGDALAFVGWASRKSGKRVRLPTEAEWEYAARAGTTTAWSGGAAAENDPASVGWFKPNAGNGTRPVGQKKPNALGIFDMSGNVMEWCHDVYAPYHEGAVVDPETTSVTGNEPERRVLRGGSWFRDPKRGRSAARYKGAPGSRVADNGFRVVVTNEEAVAPAVTGPGPDFVPGAPVGLGGAAAAPSASAAGGAGGGAGAGGAGGTAGSGTVAEREALRTGEVARGAEPISWSLMIISPLAAASAVVAWMLLRRKKAPAGAGARAGAGAGAGARAGAGADARVGGLGISTRARADGFVVSAPGAVPGARVRYACIVDGKEVSDVVPLDGEKETFVYTGEPPTAIRVLEIIGRASVPPAAPRAPSPRPVPTRPIAPGAAAKAAASNDVPAPAETAALPDAVQVVTQPMLMPDAKPAAASAPGVPPAPPSVPRPPPSSSRPVDSPRALIVPEIEPESISGITAAKSSADADVMASTDVDLSSSRDVALAAPSVLTAAMSEPLAAAPAMTAAEAFKVEPLEPEPEPKKADEAKRAEIFPDAPTKIEDKPAEISADAPTKIEEKPAEKPAEASADAPTKIVEKPAEISPDAPTKIEEKPAEVSPDAPTKIEEKPAEIVPVALINIEAKPGEAAAAPAAAPAPKDDEAKKDDPRSPAPTPVPPPPSEPAK